jgi:general secretion pathway protein K
MRSQDGVAIILALAVVALAAMIASAMMVPLSAWTSEMELSADHLQARKLVESGVDWAQLTLTKDISHGTVDHLGEPWARKLASTQIENAELDGLIEDQQGAFNLNNLVQGGKVDAIQLVHFQRLLSLLNLPISLADSLVDWLDSDNVPQSNDGAEAAYYLSLQPPYLPANRPLSDLDELHLVRGFSEDVRTRLRPFVTALPVTTTVNVNTAPPEVLCAVIEGLTLGAARTLVGKREQAYFRDLADLNSRLPKMIQAKPEAISIGSNYFLVRLRVKVGTARSRADALISRTDSGGPAILWRKTQ